jgi:hypothetical protein
MQIFLVIEKCFQHGEVVYDDQFAAFASKPSALEYVRQHEEMNLLSGNFQGFLYDYEVVTLPVKEIVNA